MNATLNIQGGDTLKRELQPAAFVPLTSNFSLHRWRLRPRTAILLEVLMGLHDWLNVAEIETDAGYVDLAGLCCYQRNHVGTELRRLELARMVLPLRFADGALIVCVQFDCAFWQAEPYCSAAAYAARLEAVRARNGGQGAFGGPLERERGLSETISANARGEGRADSRGIPLTTPTYRSGALNSLPPSAQARATVLPDSGSFSRFGKDARPPNETANLPEKTEPLRTFAEIPLRPADASIAALKSEHKGIKPFIGLVNLKEALLAVELGPMAEAYRALCQILGGVVMEGGDQDAQGQMRLGDGGKWRNRWQTNRAQVHRVMASLIEEIGEGRCRKRGGRAENLWQELTR